MGVLSVVSLMDLGWGDVRDCGEGILEFGVRVEVCGIEGFIFMGSDGG